MGASRSEHSLNPQIEAVGRDPEHDGEGFIVFHSSGLIRGLGPSQANSRLFREPSAMCRSKEDAHLRPEREVCVLARLLKRSPVHEATTRLTGLSLPKALFYFRGLEAR